MPNTMLTRNCQQCGKLFEYPYKERNERRFCSHACYIAAKPRGKGARDHNCVKDGICDTCGKAFSYRPADRHGRNNRPLKGLYCCRQCADLAKRTRLTIPCRWCDKPFIVTPTEFKSGRRLCSWECRLAEREDAKHRICEMCGKEFTVNHPSTFQITCGRECANNWRRKENRWRTNGKVRTSLLANGETIVGYTHDWYKLSPLIQERDGNVCVECDAIENLHTHHIDYDKTNNAPDNLITLCPRCHSKSHWNRVYWKQHFTKMFVHKASTMCTVVMPPRPAVSMT